jgi:hypothetical protein
MTRIWDERAQIAWDAFGVTLTNNEKEFLGFRITASELRDRTYSAIEVFRKSSGWRFD